MIRGKNNHFIFDHKKVCMEKSRFKFVIKKKKSRHLIAKKQRRAEGMNKEIEVNTLKRYSVSIN